MRESSELAQSYADTEARLNALKEKVKRKEGSVEKMQQEIDALGGGSVLDKNWVVKCDKWQETQSEQQKFKRKYDAFEFWRWMEGICYKASTSKLPTHRP